MSSDSIVLGVRALAKLLGGRAVNIPPGDVFARAVVFSGRHGIRDSAFVAIKGTSADGHAFISQAMEDGSSVAVVSDEAKLEGHPGIVVPDTRAALSLLAATFADHPSRGMKVVAVTGTNGKTTINWLVHNLFAALGIRSIRFGTLGVHADGLFDSPGMLTTPDPVQLHDSLGSARAAGFDACVIEASSHALDQRRIEDLSIDVGVFTNLTRDHLDYHGGMNEYYAAKRHLFDLVARNGKGGGAAVINLDDEAGRRLQSDTAGLSLADFSYGEAEDARIRILSFTQSLDLSSLVLRFDGAEWELRSRFIGRHNAYNIAAAFGAIVALGGDPAGICEALASVPQVPGRLQAVGNDMLGVYIDYAHTPDALENVLATLRELCSGKLWVVFGCGGDRDRGKRPQMAAVASRLADKVVVTSDNPRTEDPGAIIRDILSEGARADFIEADRRKAIELAVREASDLDVVLVAGKGHEDYQIIGTERFGFSDADEARRALWERSRGR